VAAALRASVSGRVCEAEPLARHTTWRIGGPAALYVECDSLGDLSAATSILAEHEMPWMVLGKGSNILAADVGYEGAVLVLGKQFKRHAVDGEHIRTGAAVTLAAIVRDAFAQGLSGLEFAVGTPGTVGGALVMNAGTHTDWIGSAVDSITLFVPGEGLVGIRGSEVSWGYRRTDLPAEGIVCEAVLRLSPSDPVRVRRTMDTALRRRRVSQPLTLPSAGSVFVNPEGDSAGRLIEDVGLKGTRVGGAQVSEVHANFIVNTGGATAADVIDLVRLIRTTVKERHGIELRPEIRFIGSFDDA